MRLFFATVALNFFLQSTGSDAHPTDYLMFFSPCKAESPDMVKEILIKVLVVKRTVFCFVSIVIKTCLIDQRCAWNKKIEFLKK